MNTEVGKGIKKVIDDIFIGNEIYLSGNGHFVGGNGQLVQKIEVLVKYEEMRQALRQISEFAKLL